MTRKWGDNKRWCTHHITMLNDMNHSDPWSSFGKMSPSKSIIFVCVCVYLFVCHHLTYCNSRIWIKNHYYLNWSETKDKNLWKLVAINIIIIMHCIAFYEMKGGNVKEPRHKHCLLNLHSLLCSSHFNFHVVMIQFHRAPQIKSHISILHSPIVLRIVLWLCALIFIEFMHTRYTNAL